MHDLSGFSIGVVDCRLMMRSDLIDTRETDIREAHRLNKERCASIYKVASRHSVPPPSAPIRNGTIFLVAQPPLLIQLIQEGNSDLRTKREVEDIDAIAGHQTAATVQTDPPADTVAVALSVWTLIESDQQQRGSYAQTAFIPSWAKPGCLGFCSHRSCFLDRVCRARACARTQRRSSSRPAKTDRFPPTGLCRTAFPIAIHDGRGDVRAAFSQQFGSSDDCASARAANGPLGLRR